MCLFGCVLIGWFFFTDSGPLREAAEQVCLVWDLVVALWGKLKEDGDDEEGKLQ